MEVWRGRLDLGVLTIQLSIQSDGEKAAGTLLVTSEGHCPIDVGQGVEKHEVDHGVIIYM